MDNEYVLGTVFLYGYYQIYDFENNKIGFNGDYINFNKVDPEDPDNPEQPNKSNLGIVIIIILILVGMIAGGIFWYKKDQEKKTRRQLNQANLGLI